MILQNLDYLSSKPIATNQMRVAPKNHEHINEVPTRQNTQTQNESEILPKKKKYHSNYCREQSRQG